MYVCNVLALKAGCLIFIGSYACASRNAVFCLSTAPSLALPLASAPGERSSTVYDNHSSPFVRQSIVAPRSIQHSRIIIFGSGVLCILSSNPVGRYHKKVSFNRLPVQYPQAI